MPATSSAYLPELPDYFMPDNDLVRVLTEYEAPSFDCFFVYPKDLRDSARVTVFRDARIRRN